MSGHDRPDPRSDVDRGSAVVADPIAGPQPVVIGEPRRRPKPRDGPVEGVLRTAAGRLRALGRALAEAIDDLGRSGGAGIAPLAPPTGQ